MSETTCSTCTHWHKQEPPKPVGIQLLKKDKPPLVGDCREQLRLVVLPNGALMSCYAQTQEGMPACSRHEERTGSAFAAPLANVPNGIHCVKCGKTKPPELFRLTGNKCDSCVSHGELP